MSLNVKITNLSTDPESNLNYVKNINQGPQITENYPLKAFQSSLNLLAHLLIGMTLGIVIIFVFVTGLPLNATRLHAILCVLGYQLLMAQAILSLCPHNGWSNGLRLADKRKVHTILQISGSILAIAGSIYKSLDETVNWNTYHGQFALVALVFTTVSLVNGLASLFAHKFRKFLPGNISKITHICFGIVAFGASCITLCYGFDKNVFKNWASPPLAYTAMGFTACFTFIIIINPAITFYNKSVQIIKK